MGIARIAKAANVSYATAWRVINNHPCASPKAVEAVRRAMAEAGIDMPAVPEIPEGARRRGRPRKDLDGIRTRNVALLHLREGTGLSTAILGAVQRMLGAKDLNLVFGEVRRAGDLPPAVRKGNVDGILGYGQFPDGAADEVMRHVPAVWMMSRQDGKSDDWGDRVRPDHEAIGRLAAELLLGKGHRRVACVNPDGESWYAQRLSAFRASAEALGANVVELGHARSRAAGVDEVVELAVAEWAATPEPRRATGLFVPVDRVTLKVHRALERRAVPLGREHLELVSVDNERTILELMHPAPVSIDLQHQEIARLAVERLLWRMKHGSAAPQVVMTVMPTLGDAGNGNGNGIGGGIARGAPPQPTWTPPVRAAQTAGVPPGLLSP